MIGEPTLVRYSVCLIARTSGSSAACASERDDRVVGLVRMVQQHVALVEHREQIGVLCVGQHVHRLVRRHRAGRRVPADRRVRISDAQVERPGDDVDVVGAEVELIAEPAATSSSDARTADLEPDDVAAAPPAQFALDHVPAACARLRRRAPARRRAPDGSPRTRESLSGKEHRQVRADDLFEQHERHRRLGELARAA